ncbi:MAG: tRNA pseudouridine(38-40) synthase TruA [Acidimicrobiia bacterium]|nr:tRNA pseudouridine(38-40) synthase TruA [Acidimicrobiia bacterium]
MSRNLRLEVAYDGTSFHGWQIQPNLDTIQGQLTRAIERIVKAPVQLHGSGRTDAGAHALAQVCNFKCESQIPLANFKKAINSLLPPAIRVNSIEEASESFHARFDARSKHYRYRILAARDCSPFDYRFVHHVPRPLDFRQLSAAAACLVGEHDFSSFCDAESEVEFKVRQVTTSLFVFDTSQRLMEYNICANGFLHHMVRNIVGTLLEVGRGRISGESLPKILHSKNRSNAGPTAPAKGLFLVSVRY